MSERSAFSREYSPPAPVLPLRVSAPGGGSGIGLLALVDTGADVSIIPEASADVLGLPVISKVRVQGVTGAPELARVRAAVIEVAGVERLAELVSFGEETILGRDCLKHLVLKLDGPRATLEVGVPPSPTDRKRLRRVR